jgi:hypothetical protein
MVFLRVGYRDVRTKAVNIGSTVESDSEVVAEVALATPTMQALQYSWKGPGGVLGLKLPRGRPGTPKEVNASLHLTPNPNSAPVRSVRPNAVSLMLTWPIDRVQSPSDF